MKKLDKKFNKLTIFTNFTHPESVNSKIISHD